MRLLKETKIKHMEKQLQGNLPIEEKIAIQNKIEQLRLDEARAMTESHPRKPRYMPVIVKGRVGR